MNESKARTIVVRLLASAAGLRYGSVSVFLRLHDGRIVDVTYSTTEKTREFETKQYNAEETGAEA